MYLGNLSATDQSIAKSVRWLAIGLLSGLMVTGIWQFLFHRSDPAWSRYELGSHQYLHPVASTGIAEVHAALADLAGMLTLFVVAWVSARVLHRVSWSALGALAILIASLYTGTLIRFNATVEAESLRTDTRGYGQFFRGSADGAVTDRFELDRVAMIAWSLMHIVSVPVLVLAATVTLRRAEQRRVDRMGQSTSWLDALPNNPRSVDPVRSR